MFYLFIYYLFYQGYQFWTIADENGRFSIDNVRIGDYNLYAWVPGVIGDYKYNAVLPITPGLVFNVMKLFKFISNPNVLLTYYFIVIWNWISCEAGLRIDVGELVYKPPRDGPTLWEIGIPDRSAAEFYVPDPNHLYINKLYLNHPDRLVPFNCELFVTFIWN